ncbi:two component, sigma54 specific, transcriptional regulator, Fis family [Desulfovibrio sp. X2]|uniref:sigma-54-dependent transcriptional regulator n=1 Tax=Desulfovibrio sp. X2 TaxID=941449 RepID=UPI000358C733|nr:sigma-54 dependent transcriptional regulator [Desulfovibrio sp. X2]EPR44152.1 two component, sigma54 specific, transcriptional regulator, Fis family [Desulfovibrio sp. X2]
MDRTDSAPRILIVDDDIAFQGMLREAVGEKGFAVDCAASAEEGIRTAASGVYNLILLDVRLPGMSGIEAIPHFREASPSTEIIIMTAYAEKDSAVQAIRRGAYDYFTKPFSLAEMEIVIRRALEKQRLQRQVRSLRRTLDKEGPLGRIIGQGEAMWRVKDLIERVAPLDSTVLVIGETGTGKELVADTVHALSARAEGPFVKVNCAAIPENLLESELFGHEKGAFTGALATRRGKFELASGGTILLDEIGDMPLHLQPKLLRAVELKQIERVGGSRPIACDVRIVAATNVDLAAQVKERKFREDLFYRLNVASIHLPPLRERKDDLPQLAEFFLTRLAAKLKTGLPRLSSQAMRALFDYDWPGNVRQLANVLERAAIFRHGEEISAEDIDFGYGGARSRDTAPAAVPMQVDPSLPLREAVTLYEKNLILSALRQAGGVQTEAAKLLGISAKNLWNKLQKHSIDPTSME